MRKPVLCLAIILLCFTSTLLSSCFKDSLKGDLDEGQVALTFDDSSVDNWFAYLPLLDSLHIKATFYVSEYHKLTEAQKNKLHAIARQGHEIAYHTSTHPNMVTAVEKNGLMKTLSDEIDTDLPMMRRDGFEVTNFAYPFGRHTQALDVALLRTFKSIRALSNKQNYNKSLIKSCGEHQLFYGAHVDMSSRLTEQGIFDLMDQTQKYHDCLVLVAHEINTPGYKFQISTDRLRRIAAEAESRGLRFIPIRSVSL